MESIKIDVRKLYTQSEYAKLKGYSRARINQMVKDKSIKAIKINGATLVVLD